MDDFDSKKQPISFEGDFCSALTLFLGKCETLPGRIKELIHVTQEVVRRSY